MESRIEELKQKYWEGNTSLEEEAELKAHFSQNKTLGAEARYFDTLANRTSTQRNTSFAHPRVKTRRLWMAAAASVIVGTVVMGLIVSNQQAPQDPFLVEDPKEAYEITRKAMLMMSAGLNEGTLATTELNKINRAEEILIKN